jgi:hypothetical protein
MTHGWPHNNLEEDWWNFRGLSRSVDLVHKSKLFPRHWGPRCMAVPRLEADFQLGARTRQGLDVEPLSKEITPTGLNSVLQLSSVCSWAPLMQSLFNSDRTG